MSALRNIVKKNLWWNKPSLAEKQKLNGRKPKLGAVARSRKIRTESKIKMKEVMLKVISPGKVERARPREKVPMVVGCPCGDLDKNASLVVARRAPLVVALLAFVSFRYRQVLRDEP